MGEIRNIRFRYVVNAPNLRKKWDALKSQNLKKKFLKDIKEWHTLFLKYGTIERTEKAKQNGKFCIYFHRAIDIMRFGRKHNLYTQKPTTEIVKLKTLDVLLFVESLKNTFPDKLKF